MPTTLMNTSAFAAPVTFTHADTLSPVVPTPTEGPVRRVVNSDAMADVVLIAWHGPSLNRDADS